MWEAVLLCLVIGEAGQTAGLSQATWQGGGGVPPPPKKKSEVRIRSPITLLLKSSVGCKPTQERGLMSDAAAAAAADAKRFKLRDSERW